MHPTRVSFVVNKEKLMKILRILGLIFVQSLTFIARAINRFCNRRPPSTPEMAAPNHVEAAYADEPMDVDPNYLSLMKSVLWYSKTSAADLLRAAGRRPRDDPTQGDMKRLGDMFREKVILSPDLVLNACQLDAEDDATR